MAPSAVTSGFSFAGISDALNILKRILTAARADTRLGLQPNATKGDQDPPAQSNAVIAVMGAAISSASPSAGIVAASAEALTSRPRDGLLATRSPRPSLSPSDDATFPRSPVVRAAVGPPPTSLSGSTVADLPLDSNIPATHALHADDADPPRRGSFDRWGVFSRESPGGSDVESARASMEDRFRGGNGASGRRDSIGTRLGDGSFRNRVVPIPETLFAAESRIAALAELQHQEPLYGRVMSDPERVASPWPIAGGLSSAAGSLRAVHPLAAAPTAVENDAYSGHPKMQQSPFRGPLVQHTPSPEAFLPEANRDCGWPLSIMGSGTHNPKAGGPPPMSPPPGPDMSGWVATHPADRTGLDSTRHPSKGNSYVGSRWAVHCLARSA